MVCVCDLKGMAAAVDQFIKYPLITQFVELYELMKSPEFSLIKISIPIYCSTYFLVSVLV